MQTLKYNFILCAVSDSYPAELFLVKNSLKNSKGHILYFKKQVDPSLYNYIYYFGEYELKQTYLQPYIWKIKTQGIDYNLFYIKTNGQQFEIIPNSPTFFSSNLFSEEDFYLVTIIYPIIKRILKTILDNLS